MRDYAASWDALKATDPEVADADRRTSWSASARTLRLIASENYASPAVLAAVGSTMNNKYAEGYPGRRYYGGLRVRRRDRAARDRPREGAVRRRARQRPAPRRRQANMAVFGAFLEPRRPDRQGARDGARPRRSPHARLAGQRVAACGSTSSATRSTARPSSSTWTRCATWRWSTGRRSSWPATRPTRATIDFAAFREIADEVGALLWVDASHFIGLVAGGAFPSPVPHADVVTFTTHKALRGPRGAMILCREEHAKAIDKAVFPMMQGGPLEHCIAGKAVALKEAMSRRLQGLRRADGARRARARAAGWPTRACGSSPGGTDSHLVLADVRPLGVDGKDGRARAATRSRSRSTRTQIPFDPNPPSSPSGIRVGTPGLLTLGMDEPEMREIAAIIGDALRAPTTRG